MIHFRLDSETKLIQAELMLKGEEETIKIQIGKYRIIVEDDKTFIEISEMATNREWMNVFIANYLPNQRFEIPSKYRDLLESFM